MLAESDKLLTSRMHSAYRAIVRDPTAYGWFDYLEIFQTLERSMVIDPRDMDQVNMAVGIHVAVLELQHAPNKATINQSWFENTYRSLLLPTTPCPNPRY
jgi:hypothetical protein